MEGEAGLFCSSFHADVHNILKLFSQFVPHPQTLFLLNLWGITDNRGVQLALMPTCMGRSLMIGISLVTIIPKFAVSRHQIMNSHTDGSVDLLSKPVHMRDVQDVPPSLPMIGQSMPWGEGIPSNVSRRKVHCTSLHSVMQSVSLRHGRLSTPSKVTSHKHVIQPPTVVGWDHMQTMMTLGVWGVRTVLDRVCHHQIITILRERPVKLVSMDRIIMEVRLA